MLEENRKEKKSLAVPKQNSSTFFNFTENDWGLCKVGRQKRTLYAEE